MYLMRILKAVLNGVKQQKKFAKYIFKYAV